MTQTVGVEERRRATLRRCLRRAGYGVNPETRPKRSVDEQLFEIIKALEKQHRWTVPVKEVYERATSLGIQKETTKEFLIRESHAGNLYFPIGGMLDRPPWDEKYGGSVSLVVHSLAQVVYGEMVEKVKKFSPQERIERETRKMAEEIFNSKKRKLEVEAMLDLHIETVESSPIVEKNVYGEAFPFERPPRVWVEVFALDATRGEMEKIICEELLHAKHPEMVRHGAEFWKLVKECTKRK